MPFVKADKDINYRYWLTNIIRATTENCFRLADACGCSLDADAVARYITDIAEGRKRGEQSSPFPALLRGHLRGMFQPKHLMLKLACVRDAGAAINYEFLVEYGLFEASTGIFRHKGGIGQQDKRRCLHGRRRQRHRRPEPPLAAPVLLPPSQLPAAYG